MVLFPLFVGVRVLWLFTFLLLIFIITIIFIYLILFYFIYLHFIYAFYGFHLFAFMFKGQACVIRCRLADLAATSLKPIHCRNFSCFFLSRGTLWSRSSS